MLDHFKDLEFTIRVSSYVIADQDRSRTGLSSPYSSWWGRVGKSPYLVSASLNKLSCILFQDSTASFVATFDRRGKNCFQVSCKKVIYSRFHTEYINTSILNNFNIRFLARRFEKEVKIYFLNWLEVTPSVWNQSPSPIFPFIFKAPSFHIFKLRLSVFLIVILQTHTAFHFTFTPDIQFIQLCNFK